jgi:ribonuclease BN (tRNA processing enzyme)
MRLEVLSTGSPVPGHALTGFVLDGTLAIDAGPLGTFGTLAQQAALEHILLTHAHIDHVAGLPVLLDTVYRLDNSPPTVHGTRETLGILQRDLFNDRLMPDFIGMSKVMTPFVHLKEIEPNRPFRLGKYSITPLPVDHVIPTVAYLIDDQTSAIAILTDTAPIADVMQPLARWPRLNAVFLECSFPFRLHDIALASKHLTTETFADMARLLPSTVPVYAIHIKPRFYSEIAAELKALQMPNVQIAEAGSVWRM